ncbi:putative 1-phosphatidylinositol 3-phosphate 5-kinase isoform X1 [Danaus plexippus]|uniref:putative 1-phosphatidylinositol 3-phosphate 5-kinase isoform X1 n=1 Tax=Danaus plexippus TaxID=13037 RepID=UPI002AB07B25|nr:putative 1-phosphatidylinositol 3-phosphate 5-kinase isoform X1 [Danaus plexippus]
MEKYDTSQLTEFPRFEGDSNQGGVTNFLNKLWKFPIFTGSETGDSEVKTNEIKQNEVHNIEKQDYEENKVETASVVECEGRSLQNIVNRISGYAKSGTRYADTELARYWMPDDISRECYECAVRFSALRRRHHCRVCGQIFCSRCCSQRVPGHIFGCAGGLRVCTYCCNVVLTYLRENDMTEDISPDLKTLQESLQVKFPSNKPSPSSREFLFSHEVEPGDVRSNKEPLADVFRQLYYALPTQQHRYRLVRYTGVWRGCDVMQWVMENTSHKTRAQAVLLCQNLLHAGLMERVTEPAQFADYALYRPLQLETNDSADITTGEDPSEECNNRLVESVSSYCLDLNLGNSSARLIKATKTEVKATSTGDEEEPVLDNSEETRQPCKSIEQSGEDHLKLLMRQQMAREALPAGWLDTLYPLCVRAADVMAIDMMSNDIDIRNYVQVKKVPGGEMTDSCLIHGVVMTKNVAHRGMPKRITNPSVLLLDCSIAYQRVEGKLTSLEPLLMQEQEYLVRCAARISALRPKVVLVRGSAARAVQDALRAEGVALAVGVRDKALKRSARCAKADLVTSIDARIGMPRLGVCKNFYVKNFTSKTLMVLEGCAEPNLGCCILLRGGCLQELVRVKRIVKFMLLACYNWKLEKSFLADIEAILPEPDTFVDDSEEPVLDDRYKKDAKDKASDAAEDDSIFGSADMESISDLGHKEDMSRYNREEVESPGENKTVGDGNAASDQNEAKNSEDSYTRYKHFARKLDCDKNLSCGVPIQDFSDPLHSRLSLDEDVFLPKEEAELKADTHSERWCTDDVVLSMSPNIVIPAPELSLLSRPSPHTPRAHRKDSGRLPSEKEREKERHPFVTQPITTSMDDPALRASLAHFRATGGVLAAGKHSPECPQYSPSIVRPVERDEAPRVDPDPDPLSPEKHQRLSVLLYSYSSKSPNVPDFCVNPWIVTMEMYGRHDISLGAFLEKYCFNAEQKCSSPNCPVPMNQHVRRFVHEDVCITITCNTIGHSSVDKPKEERNKQVMFWCRCECCGSTSRGRRVCRSSLGLSLAQYIRFRVRAPRYALRQCPHALNSHHHAFVSRLTTACFRYEKIQSYSIQLPPEVIAVRHDTRRMRDDLIATLNELMLKGHETFSNCTDVDVEKEYAAFKQLMEQIHLALTSAGGDTHAERVRRLWSVADSLLAAERALRDAASRTRPAEHAAADDRQDVEEQHDAASDGADNPPRDTDKEHTGTEGDEDRGDKKTVKQIISQLLTTNQPASQGMLVSGGLVSVLVHVGQVGSVIAASLASLAYHRSLHLHRASVHENEELENGSSGRDKGDADKTRAKTNEHIEVLLKDGLLCRVYYASQFHRLRHMLLASLEGDRLEAGCCDDPKDKDKGLCEIEEGFIRSLASCVPWAARGGKSGSTFCKTKDDRYVLKEMTKPEWQQFLEFAPHYFKYVTRCTQHKLPSLLARIVGVYSVGGAGSGVLVMENVWYPPPAPSPPGPEQAPEQTQLRFDLKGASRQRLASPDNNQVMFDENLLRLRWEKQLYVGGVGARALWAAIDRDTRFLADNHVMDYSLLLGLRGQHIELGIIDYIRTFTWDKKLEHLVKKNLGSGQPTVVSPDQYRRRFSAATRKYFLHCPSHWDHLYNDQY